MDNIVGRLQSDFSSHQFDVIIGSLLGDARLECRSAGARSPITARFRVHHGVKQKEYVFWKYEILRELVSREPREVVWDNPKRNLHEVSWYFHTRSLREFGILYQYFYHQKIKLLPEDIFSFLNPRMIAVWFMDDGSYNGSNITLNTHSFSMGEQRRIVEYFKARHQIIPTIVKDRSKWKIAINSFDMHIFLRMVAPYIIPSMIYKIGNPRNDLSRSAGQSEHNLANTSVPTLGRSGKV